ncbi:MAG: septum formation inhibitor Maf [Betaproteobacteria bacterium]|nr:septum formation inhibitor Maf [Betaproteobacteria bacterium]
MTPGGKRLYLASRSPRRRELLKQIGINFELLLIREDPSRGADLDEKAAGDELPQEYALRIARDKAETGWSRVLQRKLPHLPLLTADTVVSIDDVFLGKPGSRGEAVSMLKQLSGREHKVYTAVAIALGSEIASALSVTTVRFRELDGEEIRYYVSSSEPLDKAGAYAIQGRAAVFVERIEGSYSGVVGLPLYETSRLLRQFGFSTL